MQTHKPQFLVAIVVGSSRFPTGATRYATRAAANKAAKWHQARRPGLVFTVVVDKAERSSRKAA